MNMNEFLNIKKSELKRVNFEMTYVDMADGDLIAGLLLSQIIYWFLPSKEGKNKTKATYKGKRAIAKNRDDWHEEVRITARQYDRAIKILQDLQIVEVKNSMFDGKRTPFIILNEDVFLKLYAEQLSKYNSVGVDKSVIPKPTPTLNSAGINKSVTPVSLPSNTDIDKIVQPLTESTSESTSEIVFEGFNGSTSEKMPRDTSTDEFDFNIFNKQIETVMDGISDRGSIGNFAAQDVKEFFEMYYRIGSAIRSIKPIKLKNEQIANVVRAIAYIDKVEYNPDLDDYQMMIRDYFKQKFEDCDYSINHFISGDVILMRYYNLQKSKV